MTTHYSSTTCTKTNVRVRFLNHDISNSDNGENLPKSVKE